MDENDVKAKWHAEQEQNQGRSPAPSMASEAQAVLMQTLSPVTAREILRQRITQLQREAKQLEALYKSLPLELPPLANDALLELLYRR